MGSDESSFSGFEEPDDYNASIFPNRPEALKDLSATTPLPIPTTSKLLLLISHEVSSLGGVLGVDHGHS